jgi:ABC-type transporter MlaC component
MEQTAVEFVFNAVYRDMPYPELLGILAEAKNIEKKQQDEFAIGFEDWCKQEYDVENTAYHNKWLDVDGKYVLTKELLEIYKKEKGL